MEFENTVIPDCACLDVRILGPKPEIWIMLFTCGREVQTEKKISVFENIRISVETASGIVLCFSRQACCLLCCLCHINNGSHTYQFTFELLLLCFRMWL